MGFPGYAFVPLLLQFALIFLCLFILDRGNFSPGFACSGIFGVRLGVGDGEGIVSVLSLLDASIKVLSNIDEKDT